MRTLCASGVNLLARQTRRQLARRHLQAFGRSTARITNETRRTEATRSSQPHASLHSCSAEWTASMRSSGASTHSSREASAGIHARGGRSSLRHPSLTLSKPGTYSRVPLEIEKLGRVIAYYRTLSRVIASYRGDNSVIAGPRTPHTLLTVAPAHSQTSQIKPYGFRWISQSVKRRNRGEHPGDPRRKGSAGL